ncbi:MAG: hypothetical protein EOP39_04340 [Rubrivivax sp.]|nr:MAG: hypothetical protein EOP39_04340 [Rubrivivax sp.]
MSQHRRKIGARLGLVGYASILRELQKTPATIAQVVEAHCIAENTAGFVLRKMHAVRLIHIGAWRQREARSKGFAAVWHFGAGVDAPYPEAPLLKVGKRANYIACSMVALAELMRTLEVPSTKAELMERSGLNEETIRVFLNHARRIHLVRIADWQPTEGDGYQAALWQLGAGPSPARPKAVSRREIDRHHSAKRSLARKAMSLHRAVLGVAMEAA